MSKRLLLDYIIGAQQYFNGVYAWDYLITRMINI